MGIKQIYVDSMKPSYTYNLFEIAIVVCYQILCQGTFVPQLLGADDCQ